jgi:hypothetical protein
MYRRKNMQVGDLVKLWLDAETPEVGIVTQVDTRTIPEKIFIRTHDGRVVDGWDDECEVISAAG